MTDAAVFLATADVAALLSVSPDTVQRLINEGAIPAVRVRGQFRIHSADFDEFVRSHPVVPGCPSKPVMEYAESMLNAVPLSPVPAN